MRFPAYPINRENLTEHLRFLGPKPLLPCPSMKFLFVANAKCGLTTIRTTLQNFLPDLLDGKRHPEQHNQWYTQINDELLKDYYIFTVVRNPWDRVVSIATYFNINISDYVNNINSYRETDKNIAGHSRPQHHSCFFDGKRFANTICRLETIQADFNVVCDHLGISRLRIPKTNATRHRPYYKHYTGTMQKIIENFYLDDIKHLGYSFEEPFRKSSKLPKAVKHIFDKHIY